MLKEIHEQPKAVQDTIGAYVKEGHIDFSETGLTDEKLASLKRIYIIACGSAYHVGMVGKYVIESMAKIPVEWMWLLSSVTVIRSLWRIPWWLLFPSLERPQTVWLLFVLPEIEMFRYLA